MSTKISTGTKWLENDTMAFPGDFGDAGIDNNVSVSGELLSLNESTTLQPSTGHNDHHSMHANEILIYIQYGIVPFFLVTGLLGNTLTVVTMASRNFSHLTSRSILIFLAISDSVFLLTQPFNRRWVLKLIGTDIRALSDVSCKVFFVIYRSAKMTSSWLVVLLCFERFVAVVFPFKAKAILQKRFFFSAIAINYVINIGYNSAWSFSTQVVNGVCRPDMPSKRHRIFAIIGSTIYSFLPTFLLLIFTPMIIRKLRLQMAKKQVLSDAPGPSTKPNNTKTTNNRARDGLARASYMVLGVMVAYIILIMPITLVQLVAFAQGASAFNLATSAFFVYREVAQVLEQVNFAVNFIFYVLFSTVFRRRLVHLVCCCCRRGGGLGARPGVRTSDE